MICIGNPEINRSDLTGLLLPDRWSPSLEKAVAEADGGEGVLMPAWNYPALAGAPTVSAETLELAAKRNLKLYVEYPDYVGKMTFGEPVQPPFSRAVVTDERFGTALAPLSILATHGAWCRRAAAQVLPLLEVGRVAGYRHATFGRPDQSLPLLFFHPGYPNVLVAATSLAHFRHARLAPMEDWRAVLEWLARFLGRRGQVAPWRMRVAPRYARNGKLPADAAEEAFRASLNWLSRHALGEAGNGVMMQEGFASGIDGQGRQLHRPQERGDCTGECALPFALDWELRRDPNSRRQCHGLLQRLFTSSELICLQPENPAYGMLNFYAGIHGYYGDDNCRAALSAVLATALTGSRQWDYAILRCLLSVLRTTGPLGYRHSRLDWPANFADQGRNWDFYRDEPTVNRRAHSQAWMWAAFLVAWRLTGHLPFHGQAVKGIADYIAHFPGEVIWTNGWTQELARMLLPLALLVRYQPSPENRRMLDLLWRELEPCLMECGAIREKLGPKESGVYPAPASNAQYGTTEAPLIQEDGDPCCDLLYTMNFAFPAVCEAAKATGEMKYAKAASRMSDFLTRIQARADDLPELSGAWLRGFDWELWDYWGSSADNGWGAWCVETGWTNCWIASTLRLRASRRTIGDLVEDGRMAALLPALLDEMSVIHPMPKATASEQATAPGAEQGEAR
ncbi:MAG: hypothetical protein IJJ33_02275 [Victivallales bacterium]|nr:hypothetical protein [Victivallales bacterium]